MELCLFMPWPIKFAKKCNFRKSQLFGAKGDTENYFDSDFLKDLHNFRFVRSGFRF